MKIKNPYFKSMKKRTQILYLLGVIYQESTLKRKTETPVGMFKFRLWNPLTWVMFLLLYIGSILYAAFEAVGAITEFVQDGIRVAKIKEDTQS